MRADRELRMDVLAELSWDPSIREEDIATAVKDGVVTLAGTVDTYAQRYDAERAIERVKGVEEIVNDLTVKLPGAMERSDADIAHAAVNALQWDIQVPDERIQLITNSYIIPNMFAKVVTNASKPKEAILWAETEIKRAFEKA